MKVLLAVAIALLAQRASAGRILLVPLDSRPAAGQFAQLIARIAGEDLRMPPYDTLGRFTRPGDPTKIMDWLREQDYSDVDAVIVSADMVSYGGLIASRVLETSQTEATDRLHELAELRRAHPEVPFYLYSAIMRLTPTATREASAYRLLIGKYAELKDKSLRTGDPAAAASLRNLRAKIPPLELQKYENTRTRNHAVQRELVKMMGSGFANYLIFGQDDARPFGVHVPETQKLKSLCATYGVQRSVFFCEGIDQISNVLLSRALLKRAQWTPKVRIVYSDTDAKTQYATYESKPIEQSLRDELLASGAEPADSSDDAAYDYTLFLNVPGRKPERFQDFVTQFKQEADQGFPVAVADIDLGKDGTGDPDLFDAIWEGRRAMSLLSYAGWNTAGNTLGTSIPEANVYLLARRMQSDALTRELAQRELILHRLVDDYAYHKFTRPQAYKMIDQDRSAAREEVTGPLYEDLQNFVRTDLSARLHSFYEEQFAGKRFFAGSQQYEIVELRDERIFLPWPRAYEVRLEFRLVARPVGGP